MRKEFTSGKDFASRCDFEADNIDFLKIPKYCFCSMESGKECKREGKFV
jgi:hypothetical protein